MTRLLVSVRSPDECRTALRSMADVIDIKEPTRGSLGAADLQTINRIVEAAAGQRPVSVALGELVDFDADRWIGMPEVAYVKLGLSQCADRPQWTTWWEAAWQQLPQGGRRVAVAYADATLANSPPWSDVLQAAHACHCSILLLDTFDKTAGGLLDWLDLDDLRLVRRATRHYGIELALAGSLTCSQIVQVHAARPDFVAVRTAVCRGTRETSLCGELVTQIGAVLAGLEAQKISHCQGLRRQNRAQNL